MKLEDLPCTEYKVTFKTGGIRILPVDADETLREALLEMLEEDGQKIEDVNGIEPLGTI